MIAARGPGGPYRDSVIPNGCFGCPGLALEAGVDPVNPTECRFGNGTWCEGFPWNLSGTYVQAMPYAYSVAVLGSEDGSRAEYCRTTQDLVPNVFPKGYQWPWHATRMPDFGSSLFDPAVTREDRACCRVFTDFNRNPAPVPGDLPFSLDRLDADAAT